MKKSRAIQYATLMSVLVVISVLLCLTLLLSCSDDNGTGSEQTESVSAPNAPNGASSGEINQSLSYVSGGSACNLGHAIEYRFDWGNGTYSSWSTAPSASCTWADTGTYSVRAQARCSTHTGVASSWSGVMSVAISGLTGTVTDVDGNVYQTLKIGNQWWMMDNLEVTHYRNGDPIPLVTDNAAWLGLVAGAYCEYGNSPANVATYGRLYNWYAVSDSRGIAPAGWHVPTDEEWKQLEMFLGMSQAAADYSGLTWRGTDEGGKLKDTGTTYWDTPNTGATNESGFTALPGGYRIADGRFDKLRRDAAYWTSAASNADSAWFRDLSYSMAKIYRDDYHKRHGFSVRCVRD